MKAYSFNVAPVIGAPLTALGYDVAKIGNAVESHGNANLKVLGSPTQKTANRFTPGKETATQIKEAASNATATTTIKFEGDGSAPRMFAGWHDDTVKMYAKYGSLIGLPLPVVLRTWLDAKFRVGPAVELSKPARNGKPAHRAMKPGKPATQATTPPVDTTATAAV